MYQESLKVAEFEYPLRQLIRLGRLEIHSIALLQILTSISDFSLRVIVL